MKSEDPRREPGAQAVRCEVNHDDLTLERALRRAIDEGGWIAWEQRREARYVRDLWREYERDVRELVSL